MALNTTKPSGALDALHALADPLYTRRIFDNLKHMADVFEDVRITTVRTHAINELDRMIQAGSAKETMRRCCKQVLTAYSDKARAKQAQERRKRGGRPGKLKPAVELLKHILAKGPVPATYVLEVARSVGISRSTIDRARHELGVTTHRVGFAGHGEFFWRIATRPTPVAAHLAAVTAREVA